jgi:hypothetical protein
VANADGGRTNARGAERRKAGAVSRRRGIAARSGKVDNRKVELWSTARGWIGRHQSGQAAIVKWEAGSKAKQRKICIEEREIASLDGKKSEGKRRKRIRENRWQGGEDGSRVSKRGRRVSVGERERGQRRRVRDEATRLPGRARGGAAGVLRQRRRPRKPDLEIRSPTDPAVVGPTTR